MPKFDFISPDILLREVDMSELPPEPANEGALIIGSAPRGPAMKPIRVSNISDLEDVFGKPQSGQSSDGEIWRNGNKALPTYGLYAAEAWLASNTSPVTFVRLAGESITTTTAAGWDLGGAAADASDPASNSGAYGLWVCASGSSGELSGTLAAIIYTQAAIPTLSGTIAGTTSTTTSSIGTFIVSDSTATDASAFTIDMWTAAGVSETFTFNLDPNSNGFIRNKMNTDPHYLVSGQKNTQEQYFLGETFETEIADVLEDASSTGAGKQFGIIMPLSKNANLGTNWVERNMTSAPSKTGWIIANDPDPQSSPASYQAVNMKKLFRFVSLQDGEEFEKKFAIRIILEGVGTPTSQYPTFTVQIYNIETNSVEENYSGLNLNPNSDSYVAAAIGDTNVVYNETTEKFDVNGNYRNKSSYVYVEMHPEAKQAPKSAIPFGFYGPAKPLSFTIEGDASAGSGSLVNNASQAYAFNATGSSFYAGHETDGFAHLEVNATASFSWPSLNLTVSGSRNNRHYSYVSYFGVRHTAKTDIVGINAYKYGNKNTQDYKDLVRALPSHLDIHEEASGTEYAFIFTLDEIVQDATNTSKYYWEAGSHATSDAVTAGSGTYDLIVTKKINKMILPFMGGFDGVDITRVDPFSSVKILSGENEQSHYAYKAVSKAIDMVKDPEYVQYDLISMPGLTDTGLVRELIGNTTERADALAIIDVDSGWRAAHENTTETRGSVSTVVSNIEDEDYDTSYAACYYPEVVFGGVDDGLVVPSSVAGVGAIASSEAASGAPWFAPAGFNRGGIRQLGGATGPTVKRPYETLSKTERDRLYIANINPIANFPSEGPVVFGQKTLQQTPSALDRINVRRLMIHLKKRIGAVARTILFDNNVQATWNRFTSGADPILADAKSRFGLAEYKLVLDETTTTPDLIDRNIMYAKVFIKPAYAIEFIAIDFNITRSGIEF
jgi:hypothetical protein